MMSLSAHDAAEAQSLLGEIERLEEAIDALKRMQAERHTTDSRWLEEMMRTVQVSKAAKGTHAPPAKQQARQHMHHHHHCTFPPLTSPFPLPYPSLLQHRTP